MSGYSSSFARLNISSSKYGEDGAYRSVAMPKRLSKHGGNFDGDSDSDGDILRLWEYGGGGVQIKEADVGQPCTECSKCIDGYEPHKWRKTCKNCKCSRDGHEVVAEHGARSRLGFVATHDVLDARALGYTFVPPGLTSARQVDQYYSTLPSEEVPKLGSKGETNRSQRIVRQLPKQDLSLSACRFVEPENKASYEDFIAGRNQVALDVGIAKPTPPNSTCAHCQKPIHNQQISVVAPRLGKAVWHPSCFKCTSCDDLLVDLAYCVYEDNIYCERHYAEKMKPRCAGCDEDLVRTMGLMLSVLIACVGVIELITFYHNISRHLTDPPQRGDLTIVSDRYIEELSGIRRRVAEDLKKYQEPPPTFRLNSHEDIEIEISEELQKSRSPSPRRFLVTEKDEVVRDVSTPRKFLVSEELNGLKKSKSQDSIPEFLIHEEQNVEKSQHKPRYILKEKPNETSPLPLPRQFIVSEEALNTVVFEDTDFEVPVSSTEQLLQKRATENTLLDHEKSPSPFLTVDIPQAPRNSICNELVEIETEEEEPLKSFPRYQSEKVDVILESTNYNTTEYWTNKVLVVPSRRSKSRSVSPDPGGDGDGSTRHPEVNRDLVKYDEKYLNDLDGVSKAKNIKRFGSSRRSTKRKHAEPKQSSISQNSLDTTAVLTNAAEELKKVSSLEEESKSVASTSQPTDHPDSKPGEPFWVNNSCKE